MIGGTASGSAVSGHTAVFEAHALRPTIDAPLAAAALPREILYLVGATRAWSRAGLCCAGAWAAAACNPHSAGPVASNVARSSHGR